jgi:hypothetical protein
MSEKTNTTDLIKYLGQAPMDDPIQAVFRAANIPAQSFDDYLVALKIESEAIGRPSRCSRRNCRKSGKCAASHFDGINHPCGVPWRVETFRNLLMMQVYRTKMAGVDISGMSWW